MTLSASSVPKTEAPSLIFNVAKMCNYRGVNKGLHVLLSRTQAGPGRTVKQKKEKISRNHVQTFICLSVQRSAKRLVNLAKQDPGRARQNM